MGIHTLFACFSYPFHIAGWLLNLEILVWMVLALGIWAYVKERSWLAAICFGIDGERNFFPLIYLGRPLARKHYRQLIVGLLVFCITLPSCTWVLGPSFSAAVHGQAAGLVFLRQQYILSFNRGDNGINHSLFGIIKLALWRSHRFGLRPCLQGLLISRRSCGHNPICH